MCQPEAVYTAGFWSMQWVSAHGDSALVGILFWIPLWKVLLGRSEKKAPFFIMAPFQELERRTSLSDHLGAGSWYPREVFFGKGSCPPDSSRVFSGLGRGWERRPLLWPASLYAHLRGPVWSLTLAHPSWASLLPASHHFWVVTPAVLLSPLVWVCISVRLCSSTLAL